jgi:Na+-driven multidrug efflux pump
MQAKAFTAELKETLSLAVPMTVAQVGQMLMGLTDTLVAGRLGVGALAAVAFSNTIIVTLFVSGIGMLTSIGVVGAQAHGAGNWHAKQAVLRISLWLSTGLGLGLAMFVFLAHHLSEVGAFNYGAIMMGWISASALAAHQIAITCAATTFMFPLGISVAVSVRIGHAVGRGAQTIIRRIGFGGLGISATVMGVFAALFALGGRTIARLFSSDAEVISISAAFLVVAGMFQLADGVQVTAGGALRGLADVRIPMWLACLFYWGIAIPAAYLFAFIFGAGAIGIWIGFALGLFTAATVLTLRFVLLTGPGRVFAMAVPAGR